MPYDSGLHKLNIKRDCDFVANENAARRCFVGEFGIIEDPDDLRSAGIPRWPNGGRPNGRLDARRADHPRARKAAPRARAMDGSVSPTAS